MSTTLTQGNVRSGTAGLAQSSEPAVVLPSFQELTATLSSEDRHELAAEEVHADDCDPTQASSDGVVLPSFKALLDTLPLEARRLAIDPPSYESLSRHAPRPMPPPPLRVPCCPRPPVLNNCNDLSIFKSPSNYHTVSFSPFATLAQIAQFFRINLSPLPAYSFYQDVTKPCLCILQQPSPQICGARIADHFINDTLFSHVDLGQVACLWHGCDFMVPHQMVEHTDLARMLLTQHILIDHFKAIPVCPLCRCDMRQPPPLPRIQGHTYTVKEHIGSGWCIGLARIALAQGLPVMVPQ